MSLNRLIVSYLTSSIILAGSGLEGKKRGEEIINDRIANEDNSQRQQELCRVPGGEGDVVAHVCADARPPNPIGLINRAAGLSRRVI